MNFIKTDLSKVEHQQIFTVGVPNCIHGHFRVVASNARKPQKCHDK